MTIICEPDAERAAAIASTVGGTVAVVDTLVDAAIALATGSEPPVVVVGGASDAAQVDSFTSELRATNADAVVVVLRPDLSDLAEQITAAGVVPAVVDADETVAEPPAAADDRRRGELVTVFSAKGGAGTTTVAVNLAVALAAGEARSVCLVDLDVSFGDVAIALQLAPHRTVADATAFDTTDDLDRVVTKAASVHLDCVLAPIEPARGEQVEAAAVAHLLEMLRGRYDHVVVDTASTLSEVVLAALDDADHHVLVTGPDVAALKSLRLTLDVFDLLGYPIGRRTVVLNRAGAPHALTAREVEQALGRPADVLVPNTDDAVAALNRGEPLMATAPAHPAGVAIHDLAARVGGPVKTPARRSLRWRKRSS